jgi:hypothetical protein
LKPNKQEYSNFSFVQGFIEMPNKLIDPLFYDAGKKRWRYARLIVLLITVVLIAIFVTLTISIINTPILPAISLGQLHIFKQPVHLSEPSATPTSTQVSIEQLTPIPTKQFITRQVNANVLSQKNSQKIKPPKSPMSFT